MTEPTKRVTHTDEGVLVIYGDNTVTPFTMRGDGRARLGLDATADEPTPIYDALAAEHTRDDAPSPSSRLALLAGGLLLLLAVVLLVLTGLGWN